MNEPQVNAVDASTKAPARFESAVSYGSLSQQKKPLGCRRLSSLFRLRGEAGTGLTSRLCFCAAGTRPGSLIHIASDMTAGRYERETGQSTGVEEGVVGVGREGTEMARVGGCAGGSYAFSAASLRRDMAPEIRTAWKLH
jgi:hypothetical protein